MWIEIFKNKSSIYLEVYLKENIKLIIIIFLAFIKYFIPSFLYCLYNNLTFVNLRSYDPTTYFLLLQFRVVLTAIIFQILFSKKLTRLQWISIILLTFGCILKHVGYSNNSKSLSSTRLNINDYFNSSLILIGFQILSSCIAGVYNEYLLKKDESADIMLQNFFMYVDSIVCNIFLLSLNVPNDENGSGLIEAFSIKSLCLIFNIKVVLIILNNAAIGLVTSLFLKNLNSILKTFASALELVFTALLSLIIFKIPLDSMTIFSIAIVSFATWLYSKNPVINVIKQQNHVDFTNKQNPTDISTSKLISNV
jgi:UDP-sugar transporter A1/2/3